MMKLVARIREFLSKYLSVKPINKGTDRYSDILIHRCISDSHYLVSKYIDAESIRRGPCCVALARCLHAFCVEYIDSESILDRCINDASVSKESIHPRKFRSVPLNKAHMAANFEL